MNEQLLYLHHNIVFCETLAFKAPPSSMKGMMSPKTHGYKDFELEQASFMDDIPYHIYIYIYFHTTTPT